MCVRYATVFSKETPLISLPPGSDFTVRITGGDQWGRETEPLETGAPALWRGYAPGLRRPNTQSGGLSFYANANVGLCPKPRFAPAPTWPPLGVRLPRPLRAHSAVSEPQLRSGLRFL
jgi:hypothetical protein